jgi:hypothetical protein
MVGGLTSKIFVHIERRQSDTRVEEALLHEYAGRLDTRWPGLRRPEVYHDPRGVAVDPELRGSRHAKRALVDDETTFITSATLIKSAHQWNVKTGALIRSRISHISSRESSNLWSRLGRSGVYRVLTLKSGPGVTIPSGGRPFSRIQREHPQVSSRSSKSFECEPSSAPRDDGFD